jgi:hypothetical protein
LITGGRTVVNIRLERRFFAANYTIGRLFINEEYFCDTLEDRNRDLNKDGDLSDPGEGKVYSATAIPYGRYRVILSWSPKFKRILPEILNVQHFTSIRMHSGVNHQDSAGCILVGENKVKGGLINSRATEIKLVVLLKAYSERNKEIYINIV